MPTSATTRFSDNNLLTFGLTTRFLDAQTGESRWPASGSAQRYRFLKDQLHHLELHDLAGFGGLELM